MWWKWINRYSYVANTKHVCIFFMQFNFFMCKLSYWFFFKFFLSVVPQMRLLAIAVLFCQSSAEKVIHKTEIHSDLKFCSYQFLQIPSSFLAFHTLDVVVLQCHSSIRIQNTQKITNTNFSAQILWQYCSTYKYWSFSLLSVILHLLCWPSWTSVDIFLCTALVLSAEISNTEESNSEREEKAGAMKVDLYPLVQLAVSKKRPLHRKLFKQNKIT